MSAAISGRHEGLAMVYVKLVVSMAIWGGTWVAGRVVAREMGPFSAAFLRFFVASAYLFVVSARIEKHLPRLTRQQFVPALLLGLTGVFAYNGLFFSGLKTVPAGRAALIIAATPSVMALISRFAFGEKLSASRLAGIPISLLGVAALIAGGNPAALLTGGIGTGELYILGCVASWSAYSLLGKKAMAGMSPLAAVAWSCFLGDFLLLFPALAEGLGSTIGSISLVVWGNLVFLGVMATGMAFLWYYQGILAIGASKAGIFINLVPVAAIVLGVLILDEPVTHALILGGGLVLAGVYLTNRPGR